MQKKLESINGNEFEFRVEEKDNVSVLSGGYIITPSGDFVNVLDNEDHSDVFSCYLGLYLENPQRQAEDTIHALRSLTKLNHICYTGIKLGDNYIEGNNEKGYALLVLPSDISGLTLEQKKSCLDFFRTNKSIFGNYEKVELQIRDFDGMCYTQAELTDRFTADVNFLKNKSR